MKLVAMSLALSAFLCTGNALADGKYVTLDKKNHPLGEVDPEKALVYVVRPATMGFAIKSFFLIDDEIMGINKGKSYFFTHVEPGVHVFWSKSENVDAMEFEVEAGQTYYIKQKVKMGGFRARTKLELLDETDGQAALAKCKKHSIMTEEGRLKGMEIARDHRKDTQEDLDRRARKEAKETQ